MTPVKQALTEAQLNLILDALTEKSRRHSGTYTRTINSGYGRSSTEEKANAHKRIAEACEELTSYLTEEWN